MMAGFCDVNFRAVLRLLRMTVVAGVAAGAWPNAAAAAERLAVFDFELADGGAPSDPTGNVVSGALMLQIGKVSLADRQKLAAATATLRRLAAERPEFALVDLEPMKAKLEAAAPLHKCNGCDTDLAREAGAELALLGKVTKLTSVLIHIDIAVKDVAADKVVRAVSVDVQGDTEESWTRGVRWLFRNRIADPPLRP